MILMLDHLDFNGVGTEVKFNKTFSVSVYFLATSPHDPCEGGTRTGLCGAPPGTGLGGRVTLPGI